MKVAVQRCQHRIGAGCFIMGLQIFLKRIIVFLSHSSPCKHQKLSHIPAVFLDRMAAFFLFSQIIPKSFQFILCFLFQCVSSPFSRNFLAYLFFSQLFFLSQLWPLFYFLKSNLIVYAPETETRKKNIFALLIGFLQNRTSLRPKFFHMDSL